MAVARVSEITVHLALGIDRVNVDDVGELVDNNQPETTHASTATSTTSLINGIFPGQRKSLCITDSPFATHERFSTTL